MQINNNHTNCFENNLLQLKIAIFLELTEKQLKDCAASLFHGKSRTQERENELM